LSLEIINSNKTLYSLSNQVTNMSIFSQKSIKIQIKIEKDYEIISTEDLDPYIIKPVYLTLKISRYSEAINYTSK